MNIPLKFRNNYPNSIFFDHEKYLHITQTIVVLSLKTKTLEMCFIIILMVHMERDHNLMKSQIMTLI